MSLFEYQAKVVIQLLHRSWNDGFLTDEEKDLLREVLINFPNLKTEYTGYMLRGTKRS